MSYILDALRRAEAERDRGAVPSIHAQPLSMPMAGQAPARAAWMPWAVAAIALLLVGVLGWRLLAGRDGAPVAATAAQAAATPPPAPAMAQPATMPASMPAMTAAAPSTVPTAPSGLPTAAQPPAPAPARAPAPRTVAPTPRNTEPPVARATRPADRTAAAPAPGAGARGGETAADAGPATPPAAKGGAAGRGLIYNRGDLPADIQRQLPNLAIGGATYSQDPTSRMVIINGQVFREGDALGPDLTLEQIELKAAVLRFKGYRYRITF
ncbi:MAG: general secretion pathway protein GspB [Proteobacteria bacterium]|nr:general secretion pathway protein GspB [Pseudomonadota bacterium]